jgi:putative hydrolase of HD superfamily
MPDQERLACILNFLEVSDGLKTVERVTYLPQQDRRENSAEHSWHTALFALVLASETRLELDLGLVLQLLVAHDLVEVYAGDTFAHDLQARREAEAREELAAQQLFALLPSDLQQQLYGLWREFEAGDTPEARFARAMDRLQGLAESIFSGGRAWKERTVTEQMVRLRQQAGAELDPVLAEMQELLYQRARSDRIFLSEEGSTPPDKSGGDAIKPDAKQ